MSEHEAVRGEYNSVLPPEGLAAAFEPPSLPTQPPLDLLVQFKDGHGYKSFINCHAGMNHDIQSLGITAPDGKVTTIPLAAILYYTEELHEEETAI